MKVVLIAKTVLTAAGRAIAASGRPDQGQGSDAEVLTEIAGRTCYDSWGVGRSSEAFHKHIIEVGHGSVWSHANFTFQIGDISRCLSIELNRHHVGTGLSQRSTRFCDETDSPVIVHPLLKQVMDDEAMLDPLAFQNLQLVRLHIDKSEALARQAYAEGVDLLQGILVARGCDKLTARKQARGAMTRHMPGGLDTEETFTMNGRAVRNVIEQRDSPWADAEIRELGHEFYLAIKDDSPQLVADYRPNPVHAPDGLGDGVTTDHRKI